MSGNLLAIACIPLLVAVAVLVEGKDSFCCPNVHIGTSITKQILQHPCCILTMNESRDKLRLKGLVPEDIHNCLVPQLMCSNNAYMVYTGTYHNSMTLSQASTEQQHASPVHLIDIL